MAEVLRERVELETLLDGRSLEELEAAVEPHRLRARELAADLPAEELAAAGPAGDAGDADERLRQAREAEAARAQAADLARGEVTTLGARLPSVPAAEEELASAQAELERL